MTLIDRYRHQRSTEAAEEFVDAIMEKVLQVGMEYGVQEGTLNLIIDDVTEFVKTGKEEEDE